MIELKLALTVVQKFQSQTGKGEVCALQNREMFAVGGDALLRIKDVSTELCCAVATKTLNDAHFGGDGVVVTGLNNGLKNTSIVLQRESLNQVVQLPSQDVNTHPLANGGYQAKYDSIFYHKEKSARFPLDNFLEACKQVQIDLEAPVAQLNYTQSVIVAISKEDIGGIPTTTVMVAGQTPQRSVRSQVLPLYPAANGGVDFHVLFSVDRIYIDALQTLSEGVSFADELSLLLDNPDNPTALLLSNSAYDCIIPLHPPTTIEPQLISTLSMYSDIIKDPASRQTLLSYRFPVPPGLVDAITQAGKLTKLPISFTLVDGNVLLNTVPNDPIMISQSFKCDMHGIDYPPFEIFARVLSRCTYGVYVCPYLNGDTGTVDYLFFMSDDGGDLSNSVISAISTVQRNVGTVGGGLTPDGVAEVPAGTLPPSNYVPDDEVPF